MLFLRHADCNLAMPKSMKIPKAWNKFVGAFKCPRCHRRPPGKAELEK